MNGVLKEKAAETAAAAAIIAVLIVVISLGALFVDGLEGGRLSAALTPMAAKSLSSSGIDINQRQVPTRGFSPVRRAFLYTSKAGKLLGAGLSVEISAVDWEAELLIVTDERGRARSMALRGGLSGIRAEELETYILHRGKGTGQGLGPASDVRSLEYSIQVALEDAALFVRSKAGGLP